MGISDRCRGVNLLNHLRQKKCLDKVEITYTQIYELSSDELSDINYKNKTNWLVELQLNDSTWKTTSTTKRGGLLEVLKESEDYMFELVVTNLRLSQLINY